MKTVDFNSLILRKISKDFTN